MNDFNAIRDHYKFLTPLIMERGMQNVKNWMSPYLEIDWPSTFTPIEMDTWMAIRSFGKAPLYPQYPVGKYFVDFGNPVVKVAIECDGAAYHTDKEKDKRRDTELSNLGWVVYRISGSDIFKPVSDSYYEFQENPDSDDAYSSLKEYYENTIEGLINAIALFHFNYNTFLDGSEINLANKCLSKRCSVLNSYQEETLNSRNICLQQLNTQYQ